MPGPKPDPTKPRSRHGLARKNEGKMKGVTGRPKKDWANVTHCDNGHELTPENTYTYPSGKKVCKICRRNSQYKKLGKEILNPDAPVGVWNKNKTECANGHPYNERNTGIKGAGIRYCKICRQHQHIKQRYQLEPDDFARMIIDQAGRCEICYEELRDPHVDHDHKTGRVRGLLCVSCNTALGHFNDDPELIRKAIDYVRCYT